MDRRYVCHLSKTEVARLENYGTLPCHKEHKHLRRAIAIELIQQQQVRAVVHEKDLDMQAVTDCEANQYVWKKRMSGGEAVLQMVPDL